MGSTPPDTGVPQPQKLDQLLQPVREPAAHRLFPALGPQLSKANFAKLAHARDARKWRCFVIS